MKTLRQFAEGDLEVPLRVTWYLTDLGRARGVQDLYTQQSPQRLNALREHAVAQSAVSSNRIEGVEIDEKRIGTVLFGHPALRDRDEEELAILDQAYKEFEQRVGETPSPKGSKTTLIVQEIDKKTRPFTLRELEVSCPVVSRDMIRKVLKDLKQQGRVDCTGRGPAARWEKR